MPARPSRIALALAALFVVVACADRASACSCIMGTVSGSYESADAVFLGRVVEVTEEDRGTQQIGSMEVPLTILWAKVEVEERFKGVDDRVVLVSPGDKNSSCTIDLQVGRTYLVFANRLPGDSRLATGACSHTGPLENSALELTFCRRVARDGKTPRVIGTVAESSPASARDVCGGEPRAVAGVAVTLERGDRSLRSVTDREGVFYFDDVPAGSYTIRLGLPDGYRVLDLFAYGGGSDAPAPGVVSVAEAGTVSVRASVTASGSISGRFVDAAGKGLPDVRIALMPRDRPERPTPLDLVAGDDTKEDGSFRLDPLPPGEYVLVVNWPPIPRFDRPPVPSFVRADAADPPRPMVLSVAPGRQIDLGAVKAPTPPRHTVVDVALVDEDGKPAQHAFLSFEEADGDPASMPVRIEEGNRVRLYLPHGAKYVVTATGSDGEARLEAKVTLDPATAPSSTKIVLERANDPE